MGTLLKATLMVLGAVCVMLMAGPFCGGPEVYRGWGMMTAGAVSGLLCAWAGWRLSRGRRAYFIVGLACTFFAAAGVAGVYMFGSQALENARMGGAMWFGAAAMACLAAVGLIFVCVFGFLVKRTMERRFWLAAAHWALALMVLGAFMDYLWEVRASVWMVPGSGAKLSEIQVDGEKLPLGFTLELERYNESYYPGGSYTLYHKEGGEWKPCGKPELQGDTLALGDFRWKLADLRPSMQNRLPHLAFYRSGVSYTMFKLVDGGQWKLMGKPEVQGDGFVLGDFRQPVGKVRCGAPFYHGEGLYVIQQDLPDMWLTQDPPTVQEYRATCRVTTQHRGRDEVRTVEILVNEPLSCKGWQVYLTSRAGRNGMVHVNFALRRAPGRLFMLGGMIGLIVSVTCWCWKRKEDEAPAAADNGPGKTAQPEP